MYKTNTSNFKVLEEKTIENNVIIIFSYTQIENYNQYYGYAIFTQLDTNKYKFENSHYSNKSLQIFRINSTKNTQDMYLIFAGIIQDNVSNKYSIEIGKKNIIETFPQNSFFAKHYLFNSNELVTVTPSN
ncbi:hypothetical protein [Oceanirhabdus sp. W0125-5]|uniref:hypothetical protein n=1 Tax=Oceanirhabdus sp. W0125-5 TaxID=2999116 RepID=UPI0022F32FAC|nr:hypothetical protein [Oceanirhabdus sp. W0125-5]WBW97459.1 hypothetical protein OW730_00970 [Oceanirhabdus sp. W0125-5]